MFNNLSKALKSPPVSTIVEHLKRKVSVQEDHILKLRTDLEDANDTIVDLQRDIKGMRARMEAIADGAACEIGNVRHLTDSRLDTHSRVLDRHAIKINDTCAAVSAQIREISGRQDAQGAMMAAHVETVESLRKVVGALLRTVAMAQEVPTEETQGPTKPARRE